MACSTTYTVPPHGPAPTEVRPGELGMVRGGGTGSTGEAARSRRYHPEAPNEGANNSSGFSAVPGGFRTNGGPYNNAGFNTPDPVGRRTGGTPGRGAVRPAGIHHATIELEWADEDCGLTHH
ncbi:MAG: hypothetical protein IPF41_14665 [Flavobacteriales bacterium]|nr:hypothetical protein [Flavobacteriales bacterium]